MLRFSHWAKSGEKSNQVEKDGKLQNTHIAERKGIPLLIRCHLIRLEGHQYTVNGLG